MKISKKIKQSISEFLEEENTGKDEEISTKTLLIVLLIGLGIILILYLINPLINSQPIEDDNPIPREQTNRPTFKLNTSIEIVNMTNCLTIPYESFTNNAFYNLGYYKESVSFNNTQYAVINFSSIREIEIPVYSFPEDKEVKYVQIRYLDTSNFSEMNRKINIFVTKDYAKPYSFGRLDAEGDEKEKVLLYNLTSLEFQNDDNSTPGISVNFQYEDDSNNFTANSIAVNEIVIC